MDAGSVTTDSLVKIMKAMAKTEIILDDGSSVKIIPKRKKVTYRLVSGLTQVESYKPLYLKKLKRLNGHSALHTTVPLPPFSKLPQPKISVKQNNIAAISQASTLLENCRNRVAVDFDSTASVAYMCRS